MPALSGLQHILLERQASFDRLPKALAISTAGLVFSGLLIEHAIRFFLSQHMRQKSPGLSRQTRNDNDISDSPDQQA